MTSATDNRAAPILARRQVLGGLAGGALLGGLCSARANRAVPDLGPNVLIVDPAGSRAEAQARVDAVFRAQETAEFGEGRFAILLMAGLHDLDLNVGFYTTVAGLGERPGDVVVRGHVHAEADWNRGVALVNFWRGLENLALQPADGADRWAVSQAAPCRRIDLMGDLLLDDGGWSSGGFLADARVSGTIRSGTQQQWLTRNSQIGGWQGSNWNMVFAGVDGAPATSFPDPPFTTVPAVSRLREKPFLHLDGAGQWAVFVPGLRTDAHGPSWTNGRPPGYDIPLGRFLIARPGMSADVLNAAVARGQHILFTPGLYPLGAPIRVDRANTILLGLGLATLSAERGNALIQIGDVDGVTVAGLLFDAGPTRSPLLLQAGRHPNAAADPRNPILLADLFFRVGGARVGQVETALEINRAHCLADHLWIWRADHGDRRGGRVHVGWNESIGERGLVVRGDDVSIYGLFVEHFRQHQVVWSGERGRTTFFQCELPYDPPSQAAWRGDDPRGWAAYKVADAVKQHEAVGLGIYANFTADPTIVLQSAIEAPQRSGVRFESVTTISLGKGQGTIAHLVNRDGAAARPGATRQTLRRYPASAS